MSSKKPKKDEDVINEKIQISTLLFEDNNDYEYVVKNESHLTEEDKLYMNMCQTEEEMLFLNTLKNNMKSYSEYQVLPFGYNLTEERIKLFFRNLR